MTELEKQEFWAALGRLCDASANTLRAVEELRATAEAHEKRTDKLEVVQQWLAEKQREREKRKRGEA